MSTISAAAHIDRITVRWAGAPKLKLVPDYSHFPVSAPSDAVGLYWNREIWLCANREPSSVVVTLAHEAYAHHGLRQAYGRSWHCFMGSLLAGTRADPIMQTLQQQVRSAYVDDDGAFTLRPIQEADELAAALVEILVQPITGRLAVPTPLRFRAIAAWGHFQREVLYVVRPVSRHELIGALLAAEQTVRKGRIGRRLWAVISCTPMGKPTGANPPPRNLAESNDLLAAVGDREKQVEDGKGLMMFLALAFCLVALAGLAIYLGWSFISAVFQALF